MGDDVIRGVSGGQKKRVSTGERTHVHDLHHPESKICYSGMQAGNQHPVVNRDLALCSTDRGQAPQAKMHFALRWGQLSGQAVARTAAQASMHFLSRCTH